MYRLIIINLVGYFMKYQQASAETQTGNCNNAAELRTDAFRPQFQHSNWYDSGWKGVGINSRNILINPSCK